MTSIAQVLKKHNLSSPLDTEILLATVLNVSRSYLRAFPERELTKAEEAQFDVLIEKRHQGVPVAYLTGQREFWSLDLNVTPDTLIPRPETELLVELVLTAKAQDKTGLVADLGTGSGAIALSLAFEKPDWQVDAVDISPAALEVAKANAKKLQIKNVNFFLGDWCSALPSKLYDIIVSNPPYIAEEDGLVEEAVLRYEPRLALIAADAGFKDLQHIINESRSYLKHNGLLFLEHGYQQGERVRSIFLQAGYNDVVTHYDLANLERVTVGRWE
jgi:release factor glutamine methyltransferase